MSRKLYPRKLSLRSTTVLEIPAAEQEALLRELRQGRYGHLLAIHILLLYAAGKNPAEIADFLFCSRSSVYRSVKAYRAARLDWQRGDQSSPGLSRWQKMLRSLIKLSPRVLGWCRVRWSCAALSMTLAVLAQIKASRETIQLELKAVGYVWKRAERSAQGDGRVYTIYFTASDGKGGSCQGSVTVCVPKSRNGSFTNGGAIYDSTQCDTSLNWQSGDSVTTRRPSAGEPAYGKNYCLLGGILHLLLDDPPCMQ